MSEERRSLLNPDLEVNKQQYGINAAPADVAATASISEDTTKEAADRGWQWCNTTLLIIGLVIGFIVSVAMIVMGSKYINDCPETKMIPLFLLVGGVSVIFLYLISLMLKCYKAYHKARRDDEEIGIYFLVYIGCYAFVLIVTAVFLSIWFIVGCVYVYGAYKPNFQDIRCDPTLYAFSFWLLNSCSAFAFVAISIALLQFFHFKKTTS